MSEKFWTHGPEELQKSREIEREIDRIKRSIKFRYQAELANSNFIGKIFVRIKIRREIKKEINKIIPPYGLW